MKYPRYNKEDVLFINRGDDISVVLEFDVDITGYRFYFTLREDLPSSSEADDSQAIFTKTWSDVTGLFTTELIISRTDNIPANYYWGDIQTKDTSGNITTYTTSNGDNKFRVIVQEQVTVRDN